MSVLDQQVRANNGLLFADIGSGGGGGGGGGNVQSTFTSTLTVSTIVSAGAGPVEVLGGMAVNNGMTVTGGLGADTATISSMNASTITGPAGQVTVTGDGLFVDTSFGLFFPTDGSIAFQDNLGAIVGVSSINSVAYPPPASLTVQNAPLANGGSIVLPENAVGPVSLTGLFATTAGKLYQASIKVTDENLNPVGPPASGGDHYAYIDPTAGVAATRLYTEISSIRGGGQPRGETVYFNFVASGATASLGAYTNGGSVQSTLLTLDNTYGCRVVQLN